MTTRFLFAGTGGQGIITLALLLAEAAALFDGFNAVQTQSYGAEARGGSTQADVIISTQPIYFPQASEPHTLIALSQNAAITHLPDIRPGGTLLYDTKFVHPPRNADAICKGLPMYQATMNKFQNAAPFNITVLGALIAITHAVSVAAAEGAIKERFPKHHQTANLEALHLGIGLLPPL